MDESEIRVKIILVLSKLLNLSEKEISEKIETGNLIFWDSLNHLNLIFSLEDEFGLSFTEKDLIRMEDFDKILSRIKEMTG
ncbi:MAG: acyl carrier protein [Candidatus Marinimicrobia bacterium]|nr:acyl carrier protein [Candidatus Neomarinimicrobiota bacterium]